MNIIRANNPINLLKENTNITRMNDSPLNRRC